jgi:hypothetical protein
MDPWSRILDVFSGKVKVKIEKQKPKKRGKPKSKIKVKTEKQKPKPPVIFGPFVPTGYKVCSCCKTMMSKSEFYKIRTYGPDVTHSNCKPCYRLKKRLKAAAKRELKNELDTNN